MKLFMMRLPLSYLVLLLAMWTILSCADKPHTENQIRINPDSLRFVLEQMLAEDQEVRKNYTRLEKAHGPHSAEILAISRQMQDTDLEHIEKLEEFILCYGFPKSTIYGRKGPLSAFFILQHASIEKQLLHYQHLAAATRTGDIPSDLFALFEDRVLMGLGKPQRYGSQIDCQQLRGTFRCALYPLADPDRVDSLRAVVGMGPLSEYLSRMGVQDPRF